ncbi:MAG: ribose-phosphate diphosphokinase [Rubrivivax sp.]
MQLYALDAGDPLAAAVAASLHEPLAAHEERRFDDGECKLRPLADPRGAQAVIVASLHGDAAGSPHDRLWRLLLLASALRDHGARRVTALLSYLAYARKDARTQPFDPLSLQLVAQLMEAAGLGQVVVLEPHNPAAFGSAFRCQAVHVPGWQAFWEFARLQAQRGPLTVASPDPGGVRRALRWREELAARLGEAVGFAMVDKRRSAGVLSGGELVAGEVRGRTVLLLDDLVCSGQTLARAAVALRRAGAQDVIGLATHGLFGPGSSQALGAEGLTQLVVTDSVPDPLSRLAADSAVRDRVQVVPVAALLGRALTQVLG